jgi:hypothetical protein
VELVAMQDLLVRQETMAIMALLEIQETLEPTAMVVLVVLVVRQEILAITVLLEIQETLEPTALLELLVDSELAALGVIIR